MGPNVQVVSTYPEAGAGITCALDDPACGVPTDVTVEIRFDRFLLPSTATRQSIRFFTGTPSNVVPAARAGSELVPQYDVVERVVRYRLPAGVELVPRAVYTVELVEPDASPLGGFRAIDGAPLDRDGLLSWSFRTGDGPSGDESPVAPSCDAVFCGAFGHAGSGCELPLTSGCAASHCHGEPETQPRQGLSLASREAVDRTAVARVAHQTEVGPTSGETLQNPRRFGVQMPIIDPGRPSNSYLLYKLLLAPEAYLANEGDPACESVRNRAALDPELCFAPHPDELVRLREWFVRGDPMPRPDHEPRFLRQRELHTVQDFIRAGAACD